MSPQEFENTQCPPEQEGEGILFDLDPCLNIALALENRGYPITIRREQIPDVNPPRFKVTGYEMTDEKTIGAFQQIQKLGKQVNQPTFRNLFRVQEGLIKPIMRDTDLGKETVMAYWDLRKGKELDANTLRSDMNKLVTTLVDGLPPQLPEQLQPQPQELEPSPAVTEASNIVRRNRLMRAQPVFQTRQRSAQPI